MTARAMFILVGLATIVDVGGQSYQLDAMTWNPKGNTPDGCKHCSEDFPCFSTQEHKCFARDEFAKCPWSYDSQSAEGDSLKTMLCDDTDFQWSVNQDAWALDDKYLSTNPTGDKYAIEPTAHRETPAPAPVDEGYSIQMLCISVFSLCVIVVVYMGYFTHKKRLDEGPNLKPIASV
jgi:hypothetical protein